MTPVIEKNVPLPTTRVKRWKYPLAEMEIGDSFFLPNKKTQDVSSAIGRRAKLLGREFTSRAENNGVRIWRTA